MSEEIQDSADAVTTEEPVQGASDAVAVEEQPVAPEESGSAIEQTDWSEALSGGNDEQAYTSEQVDTSEQPYTEPGQPVDPNFYEQVNNYGFRTSDDSEAQNTLLQSYHAAQQQNYAMQQQQAQQQQYVQQMQQLAEAGQQYQELSQQPEFQDWAEATYGQDEAQQEDTWWTPPDLTEDEIKKWREPRQDQRTGQWYWDWKANAPADIRRKAEEYIDYHKQWAQDLAQRPHEVLPEIIEREFDKLFVDRYGRLLDEYDDRRSSQQREETIESINSRNSDWLYGQDANGNVAYDQQGQPVMTPHGQEVIGYVNQLRESGMTDPEQMWDVATRMMAGKIATQQLQQQQNQPAPVQDRNRQHLQRGAGHIANREGSVAVGGHPSPNSQNQNLSAGEKLRQQALSDGLF